MDIIYSIKDSTTKELLITLLYVFIVTIFLPMLKFMARTSKLFSVILIYFKYKDLVFHDVYKNISMIHKTNIPARIDSIGKKLLFSDIFRIESEMLTSRLEEYFMQKSFFFEKNQIKRAFKMLFAYKQFERINFSIEITSILDEIKYLISTMIVLEIYPNIAVSRSEIIKYMKQNKETLNFRDVDAELIRETIQITKARLIVSKYEEIMLVYRNQLSANMLTQFMSDKNIYQLCVDILNNSILPVYLNIRDTIDIAINEINGDIGEIVYKDYPLKFNSTIFSKYQRYNRYSNKRNKQRHRRNSL
jgi:hypothetical protein